MREKRKVLNFGVVDADHLSNAGALEIMKHTQGVNPVLNENVLCISCNRDQSSMERMIYLKCQISK